jgi:PST family polysaccharide transporter
MRLAKAVAFSSIAIYLYQLASLAYTVYLARTFSPYLLGIFGIASAVTLLTGEFRALGTGEYLVREKNIDKNTVKNSIGISLSISILIFCLLAISAGAISRFYDERLIGELILIFSFSLLVSPFNSINSALLTRELKFHKVILLDWSNFLVGISTSVFLIFMELGIYAIAIGPVVGSYVQFLLTTIFRSPFMEFVPRIKNASDQIKFGGFSSSASILERLNIHSIDLIVGKMDGVRSAALMSKAVSTAELIFHIILAGSKEVALPFISKTNYKELAENYIHATLIANYLSVSVLTSCIFFGDNLVLFMFGEKWREAAELVPFVSLWVIFRNFHPFQRALFISIGRERMYLKNQALGLASTTIAIILGLWFGDLQFMVLCLSFSGFAYFIFTTFQVFSVQNLSQSFTKYLIKNLRLMLVVFLVALISWGVDSIILKFIDSSFLELLVFGSILIISWLILMIALNTELYREVLKLTIDKKIKL